MSLKQLAEALGENYKAIHKTPSKAALQPKLILAGHAPVVSDMLEAAEAGLPS